MTDVPLLAAAYAAFLALVAALLSRAPTRRAGATEWSQAEIARFRGVIARTLLVLAALLLIVAAARFRTDLGSLGGLGAAALAVGITAATALRSRPGD